MSYNRISIGPANEGFFCLLKLFSESSPRHSTRQVTPSTYSPSDPTIGDTIEFTDASTNADGTITSWMWNLGGGSDSTETNSTHRYETTEEFEVTLHRDRRSTMMGWKLPTP